MATKICIDAGHYAFYNNNKNVSPVYWESLMAWDLHLMLKEELEKYADVEIITTRADQKQDLDVVERGKKAKGCNLFLSLHSNSCDTESVDRPVVIYPVSGACKSLAQNLADKIRDTMQTTDPSRIYYKWNSAHNADYYGVIRGAASVGVAGLILEHSFHSNNRSARWLSDKNNLRLMAKNEAAVIANYFNLQPIKAEEVPFTDIKEGSWYYDSVVRNYQRGLVAGKTPTTFCPSDTCTRAEVSVMMDKLATLLGK